MKCSTGKKGYYNENEVQEALIRSHIRFQSTACNYYMCNDCGEYHLTSRGEKHPLLDDSEIQKRIKDEQREQDWLGKFSRK
jgi:hypothetical protein